ncbi:MAG: hypothetical protein HEP71_09840 [Roseivirga sp.]|nr:hypothetical protein [Roseivirga sp.]
MASLRPLLFLLFFLLFFLQGLELSAQDHSEIAGFKTGEFPQEKLAIPGLWKVDKVTVGDEFLTPTAKWFLFESNGAQTGGNGGVQNSLGTWTFNATSKEFLTYDQNGKADEYGAFQLSFEEEKMIWKRTEDGMNVKVTLSPVDEKPLAPWDKITGSWTFYKFESIDEAENVSDSTIVPFTYYFGWDRVYRKFDSTGKRIARGIWHIEPHSPWLWMIPYNDSSKTGQSLKFEGNLLILTQKRGKVTEKSYFRKE